MPSRNQIEANHKRDARWWIWLARDCRVRRLGNPSYALNRAAYYRHAAMEARRG